MRRKTPVTLFTLGSTPRLLTTEATSFNKFLCLFPEIQIHVHIRYRPHIKETIKKMFCSVVLKNLLYSGNQSIRHQNAQSYFILFTGWLYPIPLNECIIIYLIDIQAASNHSLHTRGPVLKSFPTNACRLDSKFLEEKYLS